MRIYYSVSTHDNLKSLFHGLKHPSLLRSYWYLRGLKKKKEGS